MTWPMLKNPGLVEEGENAWPGWLEEGLFKVDKSGFISGGPDIPPPMLFTGAMLLSMLDSMESGKHK